MNKKMNIFSVVPGIEICIIMIISLFIPLISYNSDRYRVYNGFKLLTSIDTSISVEYHTRIEMLKIFVIISILLILASIISLMITGVTNTRFIAGSIVAIITSVIVIGMEFVIFISVKSMNDGTISIKSGLIFEILSAIGLLIYVIVMYILPENKEIKTNNNKFISDIQPSKNVEQIEKNNIPVLDVKREVLHNDNINRVDPDIEPTVYTEQLQGKIIGISGTFAGASIDLNAGESIIIGRDPSQCHLVLASSKVSRKHCSINRDISGVFVGITCYSPNGISLESGKFIQAGQTIRLITGERLIFANGEEILEIK